jgi:hypothetical protein
MDAYHRLDFSGHIYTKTFFNKKNSNQVGYLAFTMYIAG